MNTPATDRKAYLTRKKQDYRKKHRTVSLSFLNNDARQLEKEAVAYNLKLHQYLRQCIDAYRNQLYILPNDEQVRALELELKRIGNNINQMARLAHQQEIQVEVAINEIGQYCERFDGFLTRTFRDPWNLEEYLTHHLAVDQNMYPLLLRVLHQYPHAYKETTA